ncbi:MAG: BNR-4 repeat-containing protein [Candidatus Brocadiia bacterium]
MVSEGELSRDDGYRGIWYAVERTEDEYAYKYSGGLATYPQQHVPLAHYCEEVNRTFFCWGGRPRERNELLHMVSYYDHATGTVPRPRILLNKGTDDAHDNPTMSVDADGHLWVFSNSHGTSRPFYVHRSRRPHDITAFERVWETNFSYAQPWYLPGRGFLVLHTRYSPQRFLFWMTSPDGQEWDEPQQLAAMDQGHYQVSRACGGKVGTAFNYHPDPVGLNARTNLYYAETDDAGATWRTAGGEVLDTPLTDPHNTALVHDYAADGLLVYLKQVAFDASDRPVLLYMTSRGWEPGPGNDPRTWTTARWTGSEWRIRPVTTSDNNYDYGSLYIEAEGVWRLIAPTDRGPQPYNPGGEVAVWVSRNRGETWRRTRRLTQNSPRNHTYVRRPVNAHPDFYAFWADGDARKPSVSHLYFTDREGSGVWRLPPEMEAAEARPEPLGGC